MDPLSITASVITVIHLANKICMICLDVHKNVKNARKDMARLLDEVNSLRTVLEGLARLVPSNDIDSSTLPDIASIFSPNGPLAKCSSELGELENDLNKFTSSDSKPGLRAVSWVLKDKEISQRLDRIARVKQTLQLAIAMDQTVVLLKTRTDALSLRSAVDSAQAENLLRKIVEWLGPPFSTSAFHEAQKLRCTNTGDWFLKGCTFNDWKTTPHSVFWLNGIPGSGKSVLCSSVVEELTQLCKSDDSSILLYYFFDFTAQEDSITSTFLRTILSQIIVQQRRIPESVHALYTDHNDGFRRPSNKVLLRTLHEVLSKAGQFYFVIDAIDECSEQANLLEAMEEIISWSLVNSHIFATSRNEKDIEETFVRLGSSILRLGGSEVTDDIRQYIHRRMCKERLLSKWPPEVQAEILDAIVTKSGDMFRLAAFQLDELGKCRSLKAMRNTLHSLPSTLDDIYARILSSIEPHIKQESLKVLSWLCFALRPPTMDELAEALAVDTEALRYDPLQRMVDSEDVMSLCGSLVTKSNDSSTAVKLSHHTVKEYLISSRILDSSLSEFHINARTAEISIAKTCLIYLKEREYCSHGSLMAAQLIHPLTKYAMYFWSEHFHRSGTNRELHSLALDFFEQSDPSFLDWDGFPIGQTQTTQTTLAMRSNISNILLYHAAFIDDTDLIDVMLSRGANINAEAGYYGTALSVAAFESHIKSVRHLLDRGASVNDRNGYFGSALQAGVVGGNTELVALLLTRGADVNAYGGWCATALSAAIRASGDAMVELLLDSGADVELGHLEHWNPIAGAGLRGSRTTMKVLLAYGADIHRGACLQNALARGHRDLVDFLISKGVDVNACDRPKGTPISNAALAGLPILQFFASKKSVDYALIDFEGRSALHVAAAAGTPETCQYLLELGLDVNHKDSKGWSAVHYAALSATPDNLKVLLPRWNPEGTQNDNWTPFHLACKSNTPEALDLLSAAGLLPTTVATERPDWNWSLYDLASAFHNYQLISPDGQPLHHLLVEGSAEAINKIRINSTHPEMPLQATRACDGCDIHEYQRIHGQAFHCDECPDFDYCFMCKVTAEETHPHSAWTVL